MEGSSSSLRTPTAQPFHDQQLSASVPQPFDFWDFVYCSQCMLPYLSEGQSQPTVPFWATECGHVLCNRHLNPDRSCPSCGSPNVAVSPLQKDMPSPINSWFQPVPQALEGITATVRFQQEMLAKQVRFYRDKCLKQKEVLDRVRVELTKYKELKIAYEDLQSQLRFQAVEDNSSTGTKRPRTSSIHGDFQKSSPFDHPPRRGTVTPITSNRLTLPKNQSIPMFTEPSTLREHDNFAQSKLNHPVPLQANITNPLLQQFAYQPSPKSLRNETHQERPSTSFSQRLMPPPPTPRRFGAQPVAAQPQPTPKPVNARRFRPAGVVTDTNRQMHNQSAFQNSLPPSSNNRNHGVDMLQGPGPNSTNAVHGYAQPPTSTPLRFGTGSSNRQSFATETRSNGRTTFTPGLR
ncbi:hypothetical protein FRC03_012261 [Tulasnella sp. 419]|nr:hypothetical protein FRC03_012261 [Tulasnella sp. 419]